MKFLFTLSYVIVCNGLTSMISSIAKLIALNDSLHVKYLYQELANEGVPSRRDAAVLNAKTRQQICEDIIRSGFFLWSFTLSNKSDLQCPRYWNIFRQMYSFSLQNSWVYTNPYTKKGFNLQEFTPRHFQEYLFLCPVKDSLDRFNPLILYYISKEYDLGRVSEIYMPGRFVIGRPFPADSTGYIPTVMILAEEPAKVYTEPDYNVELHYLRIRKHLQPANNNSVDPLCKLISGRKHDPNDQHYRFCVAILRSSYFRDQFEYPRESSSPCTTRQISFKTTEAKKIAAKNSYDEQMTFCVAKRLNSDAGRSVFYFSRAYLSNSVFVYRLDDSEGEIYVENLSVNINIVDELDSFQFVEY